MSTVVFFCDEDVPGPLIQCLLQIEPTIMVLCVGQLGEPPKGTKDPELLRYIEAMGYTMLSRDKSTMQKHVADHLAAGRHTWGVFLLRENFPMKAVTDDLLLIWSASEAESWCDRLEFLPW